MFKLSPLLLPILRQVAPLLKQTFTYSYINKVHDVCNVSVKTVSAISLPNNATGSTTNSCPRIILQISKTPVQ